MFKPSVSNNPFNNIYSVFAGIRMLSLYVYDVPFNLRKGNDEESEIQAVNDELFIYHRVLSSNEIDRLYALWTGEEEGFLGSRSFMRKWNQGKIDSYFNFDMVSRYNPYDSANYLTVTLPKGQSAFQESLTKIINTDNPGLQIRYVYESEEDYGGSDYAPFAIR